MKFPYKSVAIFFSSFPFAVSTYALSTSDDLETIYGPIEIVGVNPSTQSVAGMNVPAEILATQRVSTSDTARLLQDVPGVSLYGAGGLSNLPAIHGMADDRVLVQVDGMGLMSACPNHMNSPLSYIDPSNVASINVFAGITPVSAGGDSLGGTILVSSAPPEFATSIEKTIMKGQAGTFYRSNGDAYGGNFSAIYANEWFNLTYAGSTAQSTNYKTAQDFKPAAPAAPDRGWLAGNEVGSSAYEAANNSLSLATRIANQLIQFNASVQDVPYELFPNQRMDMTKNNNKQFKLSFAGDYPWGTANARIFEQITHHQMQFGEDKQFQYGAAEGMPMDTDGKTRGASALA